jgi:CelD/BcsL family acetyltransferase involved in cellulose biosynthesis
MHPGGNLDVSRAIRTRGPSAKTVGNGTLGRRDQIMPATFRPTLQSAPAAAWDAHWDGCPWSTFFHSRSWSEAWAASVPELHSEALLARFDDGVEAVAPLTWRHRFGGLFRTAFSSPAETYGGWISAHELEPRHVDRLTEALLAWTGNLKWKLNPIDPWTPRSLSRASQSDETLAVDLEEGFDALRRRWTKGHRSAARKAERMGVSVRLASGPDDWQRYEQLTEQTERRWGESRILIPRPPRLFDNLADRPGVQLWLAESDGRLVAGALCLVAPRHVSYWHGAAAEDAFPMRPVNLLLQEAMRHACQHPGLAWFDMGSSGPLKGVRDFKKSFGARPLPCPSVVMESDLRRFVRAPERATHWLRDVRQRAGNLRGA